MTDLATLAYIRCMKVGYSLAQDAGLVQGLAKGESRVAGNSGEVSAERRQSYREGEQMAIKAYMSERAGLVGKIHQGEWMVPVTPKREASAARTIGRQEYAAELAVCEAKRILAEVEPDKWGISPGGLRMRSTTHQSAVYFNQQVLGHGTLIAEGGLALAESLAAFVEGAI